MLQVTEGPMEVRVAPMRRAPSVAFMLPAAAEHAAAAARHSLQTASYPDDDPAEVRHPFMKVIVHVCKCKGTAWYS